MEEHATLAGLKALFIFERIVLSALSDSGSSHTRIHGPRGYPFLVAGQASYVRPGYGEWAIADAKKESALDNLTHTFAVYLPPSTSALRRNVSK